MSQIYSRQINYLDLILKNGRMPHAFLFYGPDKSVQKNIAQTMIFLMNQPGVSWQNFEDKDEPLAESIRHESQADVLIIKKQEDKKAVGIAQIRELKNFVSRSPFNLKTKAVIVEDAEVLTEESWNALLKTLEEPSPNTVIFLLSRGQKTIPQTILSRVLCLSFQNQAGVSKLQPKDDIILSRLLELDQLSVLEKFDLAEELAQRESKLEVLDSWLVVLHSRMLADGYSAGFMETVAQTRKVLSATNANPRLVLENLFLKT